MSRRDYSAKGELECAVCFEEFYRIMIDSYNVCNDPAVVNVQGMLKNHRIAKAIAEVGFNRFATVLEDGACINGKEVVKVDGWYASSKTCSGLVTVH